MAYDAEPTVNKWARQYKAVAIPVYMNTSDAGLVNDYTPKDLWDDETEERTCECITCGRACLDCAEERDDG